MQPVLSQFLFTYERESKRGKRNDKSTAFRLSNPDSIAPLLRSAKPVPSSTPVVLGGRLFLSPRIVSPLHSPIRSRVPHLRILLPLNLLLNRRRSVRYVRLTRLPLGLTNMARLLGCLLVRAIGMTSRRCNTAHPGVPAEAGTRGRGVTTAGTVTVRTLGGVEGGLTESDAVNRGNGRRPPRSVVGEAVGALLLRAGTGTALKKGGGVRGGGVERGEEGGDQGGVDLGREREGREGDEVVVALQRVRRQSTWSKLEECGRLLSATTGRDKPLRASARPKDPKTSRED